MAYIEQHPALPRRGQIGARLAVDVGEDITRLQPLSRDAGPHARDDAELRMFAGFLGSGWQRDGCHASPQRVVLFARLGLDIDQARRHHIIADIHHTARVGRRNAFGDLSDLTGADADIEPLIAPVLRVQHLAALEQ